MAGRELLLSSATMVALAGVPGLAQAGTWNGGTGNWNSAANWMGGIPNGPADTAAIDGGGPGNSVVTLDISPTIASLNVDSGDALVVGNGTALTLTGGGTVNGSVMIASTGSFSALRFDGAQTLGGVGQVSFGGTSSLNLVDGLGPLTVGPGITIRTGARGGIVSPAVLTNQGRLSAESADQSLNVSSPVFVNQGTVQASAGTMTISSMSWTNTGSLNVSGTGILKLGGKVRSADLNLAGIERSGGTIQIVGTVDNSGAVLAIPANAGVLELNGGSVLGGTVTASGGTQLRVPGGAFASFDGVILDADLSIEGNGGLSAWNGLIINAGHSLMLNGSAPFPFFAGLSVLGPGGSATLGGGGEVVFGGTTDRNQIGGDTLTLGPAMTVRTGGRGGTIGASVLINQGVISARDAGRTLTIDTPTLDNQGTLRAEAGGTLVVRQGISSTSDGSVSVGPSGTLRTPFVRRQAVTIGGTAGNPATFGRVVIDPAWAGGKTSVITSLTFQLDEASRPVGVFDLANTALIVDYPAGGASPLASLRSAIVSAYAGGTWTGPGITYLSYSTGSPAYGIGYAEASELLGEGGGTFQGQQADGNAVVMRFTLAGDADLSGVVDFNDLVRLAQNYNTTLSTASGWVRGDFNYDGVVDFNDLVKLAQYYNAPFVSVPAGPVGFQADWAAAVASVPEPAGLGALSVVVGWQVGGRGARRRRSDGRDGGQ